MKNNISNLYRLLYLLRPISILKKILKILSIFIPIIKNQTSFYPNFVVKFEKDFAKRVNCEYGVSFSNGTTAIEAALFASGVKKNSEVVVCGHTFHATIMSIINYGCIPMLVDATDDLNFDLISLNNKINVNTSAIIIVHLWGIPIDTRKIFEIAKDNNLKIIEDASHSYGSKFNGQFIGSLGLVGCFSLQGSKPIAAGEGGICVTNSKNIKERLEFYGHFGRLNDKSYSQISLYSDKTGYGKKLRANPLGLRLAQVDLSFFNLTNKIRLKNFNILQKIFAHNDLFKNINFSKHIIPGGFFGGFPLIYLKDDADTILEIFKKFNIKIYKNPYFNLNKSEHIINDEVRNKIFLDENLEIKKSYEDLPKVDYLCKHIILLDERYLSYLPKFIIINLKRAIKECSF